MQISKARTARRRLPGRSASDTAPWPAVKDGPYGQQAVGSGAATASRGRSLRWVALGVPALGAVPLLVLLGAYGYFRASDTIAPGVTVGQVPVGGMLLPAAIETLDRAWNRELVLTAVDTSEAGRVWPVSPGEFGISVDASESARRAHAYARGRGPIAGLRQLVNAFTEGQEVAPVVLFDRVQAERAISAWVERAGLQAADATLALEAGQVLTTPSQWGRMLDVQATLELLETGPEEILLRYRFIPLVTNPVSPEIEGVDAAALEAERLLTTNPVIRAYDPVVDEWFEWSPSREEIGGWLQVAPAESGPNLTVKEDSVRAYVQGLSLGEERTLDPEAATQAILAGLTGEPTGPVQLRYLPRYYEVLSQDTLISISFKVGVPYWKWLEVNPQVTARGLIPGESLTIPPRDAMLELPVIMDKRIVISISEQHMWLYQDGELIRDHVVSTGIPNSPTMPGLFQVKSHYLNAYASNWDLYMPHFLGIYHATPNLLNGIHGLPLLSNGVRLWANVLGRPASYGCVILNLEAAEHLYGWAEDGVVVEIRG